MRAIWTVVAAAVCFACSSSSPSHGLPDPPSSSAGGSDTSSGSGGGAPSSNAGGSGAPALLPLIDSGDKPDWQIAAPAAVGLDPDKLEAARAYGFKSEFHTQGIVVIRNGYLAAEWYDTGVDATSYATSWSVAKSFSSTLVGIALASGAIPSIDQPMTTYIPEWVGTDKAAITLRDVLTMSSGLNWNEEYSGLSDSVQFEISSNPLGLVIGKGVSHPHGTVWNYSSGDTMLLSKVLEIATGKSAAQLAQDQIAGPLSMSKFEWWKDSKGNTFTPCCVDTTSRDFARFGELYLQRGVWGGHSIVPSTWVEAATSAQAPGFSGYGYQWWLNSGAWPSLPTTAYFALGIDHQLIGVFPEQHMVVVRNGTYRKPARAAVTDTSLFGAGMAPGSYLQTGTVSPDPSFDQDMFFRLFLAAIKP